MACGWKRWCFFFFFLEGCGEGDGGQARSSVGASVPACKLLSRGDNLNAYFALLYHFIIAQAESSRERVRM